MILLLLLACTESVPPGATAAPADAPSAPAPAPPDPVNVPPTEPALRIDGVAVALPGLCETSGAARDADGRIWLVDDDQRDALFSWRPGETPQRHAIPDRPWKDAEGLAIDAAGDLWLTGGHGRSRGSGKVGRRATLARFTGHPEWRLAFRTDALRPGRDPDELAPLLAVLSDRCPDCGALDGAAGREEGRALDVEAIASHEGRLLVGLRAPLSGEQAVVFAVDPTALQSGASLNDVVVAAWALPLGGRGVRDLASSPSGSLLVLAGGASAAEMPGTALYAWTPGTAPALLGTLPGAGSPAEALVSDGANAAWVFLDEGRRLGAGLVPGGPHADAEGAFSCGAHGATDWAHALRVRWAD